MSAVREESGARAMMALLDAHGVPFDPDDVRARLTLPGGLPNLHALGRAAEARGLVASAGTLRDPSELDALPLPAIVALSDRYVVVRGRRGGRVDLFDPLEGARIMDDDALRAAWTGQALFVRDERPLLTTRASDGGALRRYARYATLLTGSRRLLVRTALIAVVAVTLGLATPVLNGAIVDLAVHDREGSLLLGLVVGLALCQATYLALRTLEAMLLAQLDVHLELRLATLVSRHALGTPHRTDSTVGRILASFHEIGRIRDALSGEPIEVLVSLLQTTCFSLFLFVYHWSLPLVPVIAGAATFALTRVVARRYRALYGRLFDTRKRQQGLTSEQLEGIATLKSLDATTYARHRWERLNVEGAELERRGIVLRAGLGFGVGGAAQLAVTGATYLAVTLAFEGALSPGEVLTVSQLVTLAVSPLVLLARALDTLQQTDVSFRKLDELFDEPLEVEEPGADAWPRPVRGALRLRGVHFRYAPGAPWVLEDVDLEIAPGERVALVGRSGSGKSTLAHLLQGLLRPTRGELAVDGVPSRSLSRGAIRRAVGLVGQDGHLFAGTIADNIAYGVDTPDLAAVEDAARAVGAHEFIALLPRGYETELAEGGAGLSGGQRQRLCMARCLYRDPAILIFDEATSALDSETERAIVEHLPEIARGRTVVTIAHRLDTIRDADRILVLEGGRIVEEGEHAALLDAGGAYASLFDHQRQLLEG